ncbi:hypothetical protein Dimus_032872, partial [Dionaea muscipula]
MLTPICASCRAICARGYYPRAASGLRALDRRYPSLLAACSFFQLYPLLFRLQTGARGTCHPHVDCRQINTVLVK